MLMPRTAQISRLCLRRFCGHGHSGSHYEKMADETLERLAEYVDSFPDFIQVSPEFDVNHAMGVLTVIVNKDVGTYVINKQSPNQQIWLSSPISGPKRYDLSGNRWIYSHDKQTLDDLLTNEFRKIYKNDDIDFTKHMIFK